MKLSKETLAVIANLGNFNNGIVFKAGNVIKAKQHQGSTPIIFAEIEESFPQDFAIYDISKFMSMFRLLSDPDITFEPEGIFFRDEAGKTARISYSNPTLIDHIDYDNQIKAPSIDQTLTLTKDNFKTILNATASFGVPEIAFIGKDGKLIISTHDSSNPKVDSFNIALGETESEFTVILSVANLQFLPVDYEVKICFKGLLEFVSQDGKISYFVTMTDKSKVVMK